MRTRAFIIVATVAALLAWHRLADREPRVADVPRASAPESRDLHAPPPSDQLESKIERVDTPQQDDPGLEAFVDGKYRYLGANDPQVLAALKQREAIAVRLNTLRQAHTETPSATLEELTHQLADADDRVRSVLHPSDYAQFELLRDANMELHALREYADGISHVVPLDPTQERAVLFAKLTYKRAYEDVLANAGLDRIELPIWQRIAAYYQVAQAASRYHEQFLQQARQSLHSEEQFVLLSNYERTELDRELDRLHLLSLRQ